MRAPGRRPAIALASAALVALATPVLARADLIAAYDRYVPGQGFDIALIDSTGRTLPLPGGVNSPADELHPSLSADGRFLALERSTPPPAGLGGSVRASSHTILLFDRTTGRGVSFASDTDGTPAVSVGGTTLLTGVVDRFHGFFEQQPGVFGLTPGSVVRLDDTALVMAQRAAPQDVYGLQTDTGYPGFVGAINPSMLESGRRLTWAQAIFSRTTSQQLLAVNLIGPGTPAAGRSGTQVPGRASSLPPFRNHPALRPSDGYLAYEEYASVSDDGTPAQGNIRGATPTGQVEATPATFTSALDEGLPAWAPNGRQLAFVRTTSSGERRLFLYNLDTQTLVNPQGVGLGVTPGGGTRSLQRIFGNLSVADDPAVRSIFTFTLSPLPQGALLLATLGQSGSVGILVQRVVGRHRLFGREVPRLVTVGRVPLGRRPAGRSALRWPLRVNGRLLPPGRYQITLRSLAGDGRIRALSRPRLLVVPRRP